MDLIASHPCLSIKCLDKGFVRLVDMMPRVVPDGATADSAIVQAARVSYGDGTKTPSDDRSLIRYMVRNGHTTPIESVVLKFHAKLPIYVARQWIRHRTGAFNEYSARYSIVKDEFFIPTTEEIRAQSKVNKQGGDEPASEVVAENFRSYLLQHCEETYKEYADAIEGGLAREQARMCLPVNSCTEWYWTVNLHNLLHFLGLRCDRHAQAEMRAYADAILRIITHISPVTVEAWNDYHPLREAIKLSRLEADAIRKSFDSYLVSQIDSNNKREREEWEAKAARLGLIAR